MKNELIDFCEDFIVFRDRIDDSYSWFKNYREASASSFLFLARQQEPNEEMIRLCESILKENVGIFSNFRGAIELIYISILAMSDDPQRLMNLALAAHDALKKEFLANQFLPVLALFMAVEVPSDQFYEVARRTRLIFDELNHLHPLLTDSNDICNCGLLAISGMDIGEILDESEYCYSVLSRRFHMYRDELFVISQLMVLCYGDMDEKCERLLGLYELLKENGIRFPRSMEFVSLALLANSGIESEQLVNDFLFADDFLCHQKGYNGLRISRNERYSHAVMILSAYYMNANHEMLMGVIIAVLNRIIQETAAAAAAAA